MAVRCVAALLCASLGAGAQAGPPERIAERDAQGWRAVGRLDVAGGPSCTATLISERVALTAAHCVIDRLTGAPMRPVTLTLRAGLRYGRAAAAQRSAAVAVWPEGAGGAACGAGLAAVAFAAPFDPEAIAPFAVEAAAPGARLALAGYGGGSPGAPTLAEGCALAEAEGGARLEGCAALPGAALLAETDGVRTLAAVVSADARCGAQAERAVAVAPHLPALLAALEAALAAKRR